MSVMNDKLLTALQYNAFVPPDLSTCFHSNVNELTKDKIPLVGSKTSFGIQNKAILRFQLVILKTDNQK